MMIMGEVPNNATLMLLMLMLMIIGFSRHLNKTSFIQSNQKLIGKKQIALRLNRNGGKSTYKANLQTDAHFPVWAPFWWSGSD